MKDIRESFYNNVGLAINPKVKKKWNAIKTGKIMNCEIYKGKKNVFICFNHHTVYALKQLEDIFNANAYELDDIVFDLKDKIIFYKQNFGISAKPLFTLGTELNTDFISTIKEIENYF